MITDNEKNMSVGALRLRSGQVWECGGRIESSIQKSSGRNDPMGEFYHTDDTIRL